MAVIKVSAIKRLTVKMDSLFLDAVYKRTQYVNLYINHRRVIYNMRTKWRQISPLGSLVKMTAFINNKLWGFLARHQCPTLFYLFCHKLFQTMILDDEGGLTVIFHNHRATQKRWLVFATALCLSFFFTPRNRWNREALPAHYAENPLGNVSKCVQNQI